MKNEPKKIILAVSGPSGSGKGSILEILKGREDFLFSVSSTNRKPRPGETEGIEYFYLTPEEFDRKINDGCFLEWEEIHGNKYGTTKDQYESMIKTGKNCIFEIDVKGVQNLKKIHPEVITIFVAPPDNETLKKRLENRGTEDKKTIEMRLNRFEEEQQYLKDYDYTITNHDLKESQEELLDIIKKLEK